MSPRATGPIPRLAGTPVAGQPCRQSAGCRSGSALRACWCVTSRDPCYEQRGSRRERLVHTL